MVLGVSPPPQYSGRGVKVVVSPLPSHNSVSHAQTKAFPTVVARVGSSFFYNAEYG